MLKSKPQPKAAARQNSTKKSNILYEVTIKEDGIAPFYWRHIGMQIPEGKTLEVQSIEAMCSCGLIGQDHIVVFSNPKECPEWMKDDFPLKLISPKYFFDVSSTQIILVAGTINELGSDHLVLVENTTDFDDMLSKFANLLRSEKKNKKH
jgi:hypothetical protein